ncbi:hypothetical protein ACWC2T_33665 [Streptomyces sp. NPDC001393]
MPLRRTLVLAIAAVSRAFTSLLGVGAGSATAAISAMDAAAPRAVALAVPKGSFVPSAVPVGTFLSRQNPGARSVPERPSWHRCAR